MGYGEPVIATHIITITSESAELQAVDSATIAGQDEGVTEQSYPFTITVEPTTTTTPITYTWQATDLDPISHTGEHSDTQSFSWSTSGDKTVTVMADNGYGEPVIATHMINIKPGEEHQAITVATISGKDTGYVSQSYPFTATVTPITATTPITYTWQATGQEQETVSQTDMLSDTVSYTWNVTGTKTITVMADNGYREPVVATYSIDIDIGDVPVPVVPGDEHTLYLPLVAR